MLPAPLEGGADDYPPGGWEHKHYNMKQEQTTTENTNCIVVVLAGDIEQVGYEGRLNCCRQLAGVLGVYGECEEVSQQTAFPDSLFLSDEDLQKQVGRCSDTDTLQALYRDNRHRIDNKPLLQQAFAGRRRQLERMNAV